MMDVETMVERANALPEAIGGDLQGFGGILRCTVCGREQPVGDPDGRHLCATPLTFGRARLVISPDANHTWIQDGW